MENLVDLRILRNLLAAICVCIRDSVYSSMYRASRFPLIVLLAALVILPAARAQQPSYPDDNWIPQGMEVLGRHASFHTDLTFDKSMLDMANNFGGDDDTARAIAKLRGISLHTYRYPEPGLYDPSVLDSVRAQYHDRGWKHLVTKQGHAEALHPGRTDVWVRFAHGNVEGMVLLAVNEKNVNLVAINGTLSPIDLLHLRGHFGIPRFSGDGFEDQKY
jgi:Domain of unknown function (DUF4252)